jgi:cytoskeletal protein CcmA (bactofilin family)/ribosomal protein S27E
VFGKRYRSKKVDLTCPYCGHLQQEPSQVISSFCRSCGEHFRVRKGVAIANPGLRVSGIAEVRPPRKRNPLLAAPELSGTPAPAGNSWLVSAEAQEAGARPLPEPAPRSAGDGEELTAGAFFGLGAPNVPSDAVETSGPSLGRNAHSREALAEGSMGALIAAQQTVVVAEKDKMPPNYAAPDDRRRRDDNVPEIRVRCFRCHHHQDVSRFAKSTQCERCSAYISLANYEIKTVKSHTLRTRGDIIIAKKGGLINNSEIACHHLTVSGSIDATVDCTGDAVFRHSGTVRGQLHCEKLVIEKNCEVRFPDGVMANRAEIAGHLIGDLTCSGKVRVARTGIVEGDLASIDLELRDGGRISGETRLDPGITTELALRKGFNPTVIG